jgi:hypothetical protein
MKEGKWEVEDKGDLIIIAGTSWAEIECPKFSKFKEVKEVEE